MVRPGQTGGTASRATPWSDYDPYTDQALLNPWPGYKRLRDAGPAVWLPKYRMFALTRYDSVRRALMEWASFQSHNGVMMNDRSGRRTVVITLWGVGRAGLWYGAGTSARCPT